MRITWTHLESVWNPSGPSEVPYSTNQYTEVHFASFLSGWFITAKVVNPPERKLAKRCALYFGSLLLFCPTFLSFFEFTLKNLFAWAGSSFISWHATKELFFSLFFFSLSFPGHDGVARCQYYSRSTMMFDMKEKKENFRQSLFCQCQLWSFKFRVCKIK